MSHLFFASSPFMLPAPALLVPRFISEKAWFALGPEVIVPGEFERGLIFSAVFTAGSNGFCKLGE